MSDQEATPEVDHDATPEVDHDATPEVDHDGRRIVDAIGMPCPRPVIELAAAIKQVAIGDEVRLLADDPAADVDVPVWCRMQRQELVAQTTEDDVLVFVVRKLRET